MRFIHHNPAGLSVRAIAGTRVVTIALNLPIAKTKSVLGFSFERAIGNGAFEYLKGKKAFAKHVKKPSKDKASRDAFYSTMDDPIQSFLWSDESDEVQPGTRIRYRVKARKGTPGSLTDSETVEFEVRTEKEDDGKHAIYFNRGAIASQAFSREFSDNPMLTEEQANDRNHKKTKFLSRGLLEGFHHFMETTKSGESLKAVVYEHHYKVVLDAFKAAQKRGVNVKIVYDDKQGEEADDARNASGLAAGTFIARKKGSAIPHNKFIVRLDAKGKAKSVWTGSTNFTPSGFLGQTNVGHVVHDSGVAEKYLKYFTALKGQPDKDTSVAKSVALTPDPPNTVAEKSITPLYSPRGGVRMLNWYGARVADAATAVMFTAPFNTDIRLIAPMAVPRESNNFVLMDQPPKPEIFAAKKNNPSGFTFSYGAVLGQIKVNTGKVKNGKPVFEKVHMQDFPLDRWFLKEELARKGSLGVFYIHTKILMIDPLSDDPLVCTGSANFSENSQRDNDENMLLIRGDTRVADIYLTEFDRIFRHFFFRDIANLNAKKTGDMGARKGALLDETDSWTAGYYMADNPKSRRREMFFTDEGKSWVAKSKTDADVFKGKAPTAEIPGFVKTAKKPAKKKAKKSIR